MPTMKTIGTIAQCAGVAISAVAVCYPIVHAGAELLFGSSVVIAGLLMNPNSFCGMDARIVPVIILKMTLKVRVSSFKVLNSSRASPE